LEQANQEYFTLEKAIQELEARQRSLKEVVGEELPTVPVMAKLTQIVPPNIQLGTFALSNRTNCKMTGVVSGEPHLLDIDLAQFMIDLERSPSFKQVQLVSKNRSTLQGETVLEFEIQCVTE